MAQQGHVDHAPLVGEYALLAGGRFQDLPGRRDLGGRGPKGSPDDRHLARVDAGGGAKSACDGIQHLGLQTLEVRDGQEHTVHGCLAVRPGRQQHRGTGVTGDGAVAAVGEPARAAAERGHQIVGAPHQRHHIGLRRDRRGGEHPRGRLAERDHLEPGEVSEVGGADGLRQHHRAIQGVVKSGKVQGEVGRTGRVDTHDGALGVKRMADQHAAGPHPVLGQERVFQVEDHGIRPLRRLAVAVGAVGRAEQQRRSEVEAHLTASRHQTRTVRSAVATTSSCWFRPMCRRVTSPWPGRDSDSLRAVTIVSE